MAERKGCPLVLGISGCQPVGVVPREDLASFIPNTTIWSALSSARVESSRQVELSNGPGREMQAAAVALSRWERACLPWV